MHLSCFFTQNISAIVNIMANFKRSNFASSAVSYLLSLQKNRTVMQLTASTGIDFTERCHVLFNPVVESMLHRNDIPGTQEYRMVCPPNLKTWLRAYVNGRFVQWRLSQCLWQKILLCSVTVHSGRFSPVLLQSSNEDMWNPTQLH